MDEPAGSSQVAQQNEGFRGRIVPVAALPYPSQALSGPS
jgi:hypothetical protein